MIQVYVSLIQKGLKSIEDVSEIYREEVQVILDSEIQE